MQKALRIWRIARDPDTGYWVSVARIDGDNIIRDDKSRQVSAELGRAIAERFLKNKDSRCFVSSAARLFSPESIRETEEIYK